MKTKENVINCNQRDTYLITFQFQGCNNKYIVQSSGLMNVLKNEDKNGIESIKIFDSVSGSFKRVSREKILNVYKYDTEDYLYLKDHYFFR